MNIRIKLKPTCEHTDDNNKKDCENDCEYICICCSFPICEEHRREKCRFGGMEFVDLEGYDGGDEIADLGLGM